MCARQRRARDRAWWDVSLSPCGALIAMAIIVVLAGILWPSLPEPSGTSRAGRCSLRLIDLCTALSAYAADHEGYLPPAQTWAHSIAPCVGGGERAAREGYFMCPRDEARESALWHGSFAMARGLSGKRLENVPNPAERPILWDADPNGYFVARHAHLGVVAFADGHVKWVERPLSGMERGWVDAPESASPGRSCRMRTRRAEGLGWGHPAQVGKTWRRKGVCLLSGPGRSRGPDSTWASLS